MRATSGLTAERRVLVVACAVAFVEALLFTALAPLIPEFAETFDLSKGGAGLLSAGYPLGAVVGAIPSILLTRLVGLPRSVRAALVVLGVTSLLFGLAASAGVVFVARFLQGIGAALAFTAALAWLTASVARSRRAESIGIASAFGFVGALLGPLVGALADAVGLAPVFCTLAVAIVMLITLTRGVPDPGGAHPAPRPLRGLPQVPGVPFGIVLIAVAGVLLGVFGVLVPLRLSDFGWSAAAIGAVFASASVVAGVTAPGIGRLADRRGRAAPLRLGLLLAAGASVVLALVGAVWAYTLAAVVAMVAVGLLWTPGMAFLTDAVERRGYDHASAFGLTNLGWAPGFAAGAAAGGALAGALGDAWTYVAVTATCAATVVALARRPLDTAPGAR